MMPQVCPSFITSFNLWGSAGNRFEPDRSKIAGCALGKPCFAKSKKVGFWQLSRDCVMPKVYLLNVIIYIV
jgi:hypothetical protein